MTTTASPPRLDYARVAPDALRGLYASERYLRGSSLERALLHLVKLRASQMNGCAFCIALHVLEARHDAERDERLDGLVAWHEAPWYSERERAALAWTEALTDVARTHVPDATYAAARAHFSEPELVDLTLAIATINAWNRFAVAFRAAPQDAPHVFAQVRAMEAASA